VNRQIAVVGTISSTMTKPVTTTVHPANLRLEPHPISQLVPPMTSVEYTDLYEDVLKHGVREAIWVYEGKTLDGRNRYRAAVEAGVGLTIKTFEGTHDEAVAFVISMSVHRRHLTAEQRRDMIEKLLKADPSKSDRHVAATVKADHKTVGVVRAQAEARGEIPHVETRTDSKGRRQKASKTRRRQKASKTQKSPKTPAIQEQQLPTVEQDADPAPPADSNSPGGAPEAHEEISESELCDRDDSLENTRFMLGEICSNLEEIPIPTDLSDEDRARTIKTFEKSGAAITAFTDLLRRSGSKSAETP
jgi:hypothetical protein